MRAAGLRGRLESLASHQGDGFTERTGLLEVEGDRLLYVLVTPTGIARTTGLFICHSFLELPMLQRTELQLARAAARSGYPSLYLQAPGAGDSEGDETRLTISTRVAAARAGVRGLRDLVPDLQKVCLMGARLGSAIAVMASKYVEETAALALWDPIFDPERYWKQMRRLARVIAVVGRQRGFEDPDKELQRRGWASMFGNVITDELKRDLDGISKARSVEIDVPVFLLSLNSRMVRDSMEGILATDIEVADLGRGDVGHLGLRDAPEAVEPTLRWMERRLP